MTTEQKQIAIAEFDGQTCDNCGEILCGCAMVEIGSGTPDYLTSREAICKAVGKLDDVKLSKYAKHLQEVCYLHCVGVVPDYQRDLRNLAKLTLATPDQMADALLLTLGHQI